MEELKSALGRGEREETNIFEILENEHKQVKDNLEQIINENRSVTDVYSQTIQALNMHVAGEEKLLYPMLEDNTETRQMIFSAYEEHNIAKQLINDMGSASVDNERWLAKVKVLNDVVSHHVETEENEVFPKAKDILSDDQAREIGRRYLNEKSTYM